MALMQSSGR
jgi:hypothetical protein